MCFHGPSFFWNPLLLFLSPPQVSSSYAGCHFSLPISWTPTAQDVRFLLRCITPSLGWATWIVPWIPSFTPPSTWSSGRHSLRFCTAEMRRGSSEWDLASGKYLILLRKMHHTAKRCFSEEAAASRGKMSFFFGSYAGCQCEFHFSLVGLKSVNVKQEKSVLMPHFTEKSPTLFSEKIVLATYGAICVNDTCKRLFIVCVPLRFNDDNIFQMLDLESVFIAVLKQLCELLFLKLVCVCMCWRRKALIAV